MVGGGLEDELNKLLADANLAQEGAKDAGKQATKIRRRLRSKLNHSAFVALHSLMHLHSNLT